MPKCKHENIKGFDTELFFFTAIEVCLDCGMSRSVWEQGHSEWTQVSLQKNAVEIKDAIENFLVELSAVKTQDFLEKLDKFEEESSKARIVVK